MQTYPYQQILNQIYFLLGSVDAAWHTDKFLVGDFENLLEDSVRLDSKSTDW